MLVNVISFRTIRHRLKDELNKVVSLLSKKSVIDKFTMVLLYVMDIFKF